MISPQKKSKNSRDDFIADNFFIEENHEEIHIKIEKMPVN